MKTHRHCYAPAAWTALIATWVAVSTPGSAALVNASTNLHATGTTNVTANLVTTGPTAAAAFNGSAALNAGGNPAAAIGATVQQQDAMRAAMRANATSASGTGASTATAATIPGWSPAFDTTESIGMRRARLAASAQAAASSTTPATGGTTGDFAVQATATSQAIRTASQETRTQMVTQVADSMKTAQQTLVGARARVQDLDADAQARFKASAREVKAAGKQLRKDLAAAAKATASAWDSARDKVAADFDVYRQTVAHAQQIAAAGSASATIHQG